MQSDNTTIDITHKERAMLEKVLLEGTVQMPDHDVEFQRVMQMAGRRTHSNMRTFMLAAAAVAAIVVVAIAFLLPSQREATVVLADVQKTYEEETINADVKKQQANTGASEEVVVNEVVNKRAVAVSTPRRKMYQLTLADGTVVFLNAASQLYYPAEFADDERRVRLVGEGFFKVAKDANRPFIVENERLTTKVLGTTFNMRAFDGEDANVTLLEGSVEVAETGKQVCATLTPGQDLTLSKRGKVSVTDIDKSSYSSWSTGVFYYDNASLKMILDDIGRWYGVKISAANSDKMQQHIHFFASREDKLSDVLDLINSIISGKLELRNGVITLS